MIYLLVCVCWQRQLGNTLLVYISCCLAGHAFPSGTIADDQLLEVKNSVLNCVTALHTLKADTTEPAYPHLRTLLMFDTREFFNVLSLAFDDTPPPAAAAASARRESISQEKKQRIVDILLLLMVDGVGFSPAQVTPTHILCNDTASQTQLPLTKLN